MIFTKLKKNKNKPSGKKRKLLTTIALILSLLFGKPRFSPSRSSSPNFANQVVNFYFGVSPMVGPAVRQAVFSPTLPSIERVIPNQLDSQTNQQELRLNLSGGEDSSYERLIKFFWILAWTMAQTQKPPEVFQIKSQSYGHKDFLFSKESIEEVKLVSVKKADNLNIKIRTRLGKNSIYVEAFQVIRTYPARLNYYDRVEKRILKPSVMVQAHLTCIKQVDNLPRQIIKKDKSVKFDKKYNGLFKKHYEDVFNYNLYLEENISKDASNSKIKQGKQNLYKKYGETSKEYLRKNLFENPCIIKSEECKYLDSENFVTIYYDQLKDLFAIVDSKENRLLDFGIATEVKYAEIFAYKSSGTLKASEICLLPNQQVEFKEIEVYKEKYILSHDDAMAILEENYGSNFIVVSNGEFKIQEWQAAKKIEHAVCFGINVEEYGFSQDQAKEINVKGGIVDYVRKGNKLPSLDLVRAYQNAIKNFCEDRNQSDRNDESIFRGEPSITFFNEETQQIVIFKREPKIFITAYKLADRSVKRYLTKGIIGTE